MKTYWKRTLIKKHTASRLRRLSFRSTSELIERRKRTRKQIGLALAIFIALGTLLTELA